MRLFLIFLLSIVAPSISGCLDFGPDEETQHPNAQQIARCRAEMYLSPKAEIHPLGYKLRGSGIDDAIWFKFTTKQKLTELFDSKVVDTSKFKEGFKFDSSPDTPWWDTKGKMLYGGQIDLPHVRYMYVGAEKTAQGFTVYIFWYEC